MAGGAKGGVAAAGWGFGGGGETGCPEKKPLPATAEAVVPSSPHARLTLLPLSYVPLQARIYTTAQAKKAQGKVGLGQGTGTVKVGGVKWEGKKVSFEDAEEGGDEAAEGEAGGADVSRGRLAATGSSTHLAALAGSAEAEAAEQPAEAAAAKGSKKKKGKRKDGAAAGAAAENAAPQAAAAGTAAGSGDAGATAWEAAVKWKKLITQQLAAAEQQQLRLKELQRLVVAAVLEKHGGVVSSKAAVKAAFASRLESSSKFVVEGKLVKLRS